MTDPAALFATPRIAAGALFVAPLARARCAAEGMAVPLAVKELRPLRSACGVLDREPLARHRQ